MNMTRHHMCCLVTNNSYTSRIHTIQKSIHALVRVTRTTTVVDVVQSWSVCVQRTVAEVGPQLSCLSPCGVGLEAREADNTLFSMQLRGASGISHVAI